MCAGQPFLFACPYGVYLLRNRMAQEWAVAVLVMRGTQGGDSVAHYDGLQAWFDDCGASGEHDRIGKPAGRDWTASYDCLDSLGTMAW